MVYPYITSQVEVGLLWLAFVGFSAQYFLNMEIERYTLATGETAVTGFSRMWKWWGLIFVLTMVSMLRPLVRQGAVLPGRSGASSASPHDPGPFCSLQL